LGFNCVVTVWVWVWPSRSINHQLFVEKKFYRFKIVAFDKYRQASSQVIL
jgi:hypothetical protein